MQEMTEPIEARVRKLQRRGAVWRPPLLFDVRSFAGASPRTFNCQQLDLEPMLIPVMSPTPTLTLI